MSDENMTANPKPFEGEMVWVFDADDTLWDCQSHFDEVERWYCDFLSSYKPAPAVSESLYEVECANMQSLGYGSKAVIISMVENALRVSDGRITAEQIAAIIARGRQLLSLPAAPLPGVEDTLAWLRGQHPRAMVVFTKGDIMEQQQKLRRSGLGKWFDDVVIVGEKDREAYQSLCQRLGISEQEFVMVGNSFKSDIAPVVEIGGRAVHIPYHTTWKYEQMACFSHPNVVTLQRFSDLKEYVRTAQRTAP